MRSFAILYEKQQNCTGGYERRIREKISPEKIKEYVDIIRLTWYNQKELMYKIDNRIVITKGGTV